MGNVPDALEQLQAIRVQLAQSSEFRGYAPTTLALSGVVAFVIALLQTRFAQPLPLKASLLVWGGAALALLVLVLLDAFVRSRRVHPGMAAQMMHIAVEAALPPLMVGLVLSWVFWHFAPGQLWMLPGLWLALFSLCVFASCRFLPRPIFAAGVWYLCAGTYCLAVARGTYSSWELGISFGVGQLLAAALLYLGYREIGE